MKTIFFTRLSRESEADRTWCGNDEKGKFTHHGVVPLSQDPVTIKLSWKPNSEGTPQYVGTFELNLNELLSRGVIREETPDSVRVKFINVHGLIILSTGYDKPCLLLGLTKPNANQKLHFTVNNAQF